MGLILSEEKSGPLGAECLCYRTPCGGQFAHVVCSFVPLNFMVLAYHGEASYNVVVSFHERPAWPWLSVPPRTTLYQAMIWDVGSGFES